MILTGDCLHVLRDLPDGSVDAVVTDPPYGLEFMGKEWDRFRVDDPGTSRHRGDNAAGDGWLIEENTTNPAAGRVSYGAGARPKTSRCSGCGKRDQFRNPHDCTPDATWAPELIDPHCAPPTSLAFQEWVRAWGAELYRVLKPGAHVLAFGGSRTWHRLAAGLEDVGFDVRDSIHWTYGTGFPKSMNIAKAIDAQLTVGRSNTRALREVEQNGDGDPYTKTQANNGMLGPRADADRKTWDGWGTALKPSHEPIVVARKPPAGTIVAGVLEHGTGALNITGCRTPHDVGPDNPAAAWGGRDVARGRAIYNDLGEGVSTYDPDGRWPTNTVLTHAPDCNGTCSPGCPVAEMTRQAGDVAGIFPTFEWDPDADPLFIYVAKASRDEREAGVDVDPAMAMRMAGTMGQGPRPQQAPSVPTLQGNDHPTVKPVALMRWLVRLITPPGGHVLDPFLGSGTTAVAAILEGFDWTGIEKDPTGRYQANAEGRIRWATGAATRPGGYTPPRRAKPTDPDDPQLALFTP